jgi:HEAT repeat protein
MSGPTRICPACYAFNEWSSEVCSVCGAHLKNEDDLDTRLIWALRHPDTETAIRAAEALSARRTGAAVQPLADLVDLADDPYRSAAAAEALVVFAGDPIADAALRRAAAHPSVVVRVALERSRARQRG